MVNQPELELQLKVWKELAISKQMLMRAATDALKLDPNCTQDELKKALEDVLKKLAKADSDVAAAREQARTAVAAAEQKAAASEKALAQAQATIAELKQAQENALRQLATDRQAAAKEAQKLKDRIAEQEKALKAINTALSDTPENVIKKMNALRKQKQEETETRRQIELSFNKLNVEKRQQDQKLAELTRASAQLASQHRSLHEVASKLHEQLKPLVKEAELPQLPMLDTKLLEQIEQSNGEGKSESKAKNESKAKK
jgi:chromosome segregation ATPase